MLGLVYLVNCINSRVVALAAEVEKSGQASMCNLYSLTKGQKAIRDLAKAMVDHAGNMRSLGQQSVYRQSHWRMSALVQKRSLTPVSRMSALRQ